VATAKSREKTPKIKIKTLKPKSKKGDKHVRVNAITTTTTGVTTVVDEACREKGKKNKTKIK